MSTKHNYWLSHKSLILSAQSIIEIDTTRKNLVQVNLFQKLLFLHQLTHNMTKNCSSNYKFSTLKLQAENMGRTCCVHKLFLCFCFDIQNSLCTQCSTNVLPRFEVVIFMYRTYSYGRSPTLSQWNLLVHVYLKQIFGGERLIQ